jgi:hypothetical protein
MKARLVLGVLPVLLMTFPLYAQVGSFVFTGRLIYAEGENTQQFGSVVVGVAALDYSAVPNAFEQFDDECNMGQHAEYSGQKFAINGTADGGFSTGTSIDGGTATAINDDYLVYLCGASFQRGDFYSFYTDGVVERYIQIIAQGGLSYGESDGVADFVDWNPMQQNERLIFVGEYNYMTNNFDFAYYTLESFAPVSASKINHGRFVKEVSQVTRQQLWSKKNPFGFLTKQERNVIIGAAASSDIGR